MAFRRAILMKADPVVSLDPCTSLVQGSRMLMQKRPLLSQANLDVSHALFVSLSWSAPRSGFTSLLFDVQLK